MNVQYHCNACGKVTLAVVGLEGEHTIHPCECGSKSATVDGTSLSPRRTIVRRTPITISPLSEQPEEVKAALEKTMAECRQKLIDDTERDLVKNIDIHDPDADYQRHIARSFAADLVDRVLASPFPRFADAYIPREEDKPDAYFAQARSMATAHIAEGAVADMRVEARKTTKVLTPADYSRAIKERLEAYDAEGLLEYDVESTCDPETKTIQSVIKAAPCVVRQVSGESKKP